jgi:UrcA family protein
MMPILIAKLCRWSSPFVHRSMRAAASAPVSAPDEIAARRRRSGRERRRKPRHSPNCRHPRRKAVVAALLTGIAAFSMTGSPAAAQEQRFTVYGQAAEGQIERVAFADLDLAGASGQARLHHRVNAAIERVCDLDLGRDGLQDRGYYACAGNAWGNAAPQIAEAVATGKTGLGAAIVVIGR